MTIEQWHRHYQAASTLIEPFCMLEFGHLGALTVRPSRAGRASCNVYHQTIAVRPKQVLDTESSDHPFCPRGVLLNRVSFISPQIAVLQQSGILGACSQCLPANTTTVAVGRAYPMLAKTNRSNDSAGSGRWRQICGRHGIQRPNARSQHGVHPSPDFRKRRQLGKPPRVENILTAEFTVQVLLNPLLHRVLMRHISDAVGRE
mmetsp:Transcript_83786/g.191240  ORF Transcript_83786/g.191240 Transcript_83786/m.191240 type:complete len:203 (-) Transcript_83786:183-791(-)